MTRRRSEAVVAGTFLAVALALRAVYAFRYPFDTDEAQHLHVVWGWSEGLVQYRDVFDNHTPLFHLVFAPLVGVFGERAVMLPWMRLAVLPLYALLLWTTYRLGRSLYDARVARWAAVATGLFPPFFFSSLEFRADVLWVACWLLSLRVLLDGSLTRTRALSAGILLGATLGVSLKTVLLLPALAGAGGAAFLLEGRDASRPSLGQSAGVLAAIGAGFLVVPGALALLFFALGAAEEAWHGIFGHNLGSVPIWDRRPLRIAAFLVQLPLYGWIAQSILRRAPDRALGLRRTTLFLCGALAFALLHGFWPIVTRQDSLPIVPLLVLSGVPLLLGALSVRPWLETALPLGLGAAVEIALVIASVPPWKDRTRFQTGLVADVLRLTDRREPVMDLKGETLFRERPFRYAVETVTFEKIRRGELADDIAERLVESRTYVTVQDNERFPARARAFLNENYVPVCHLRVAGKLLPPAGAGDPVRFEIAVPGPYALISPYGLASGRLDGAPIEVWRFLDPGPHVFEPSSPERPLVILWSRAFERGYSPFAPLRDH